MQKFTSSGSFVKKWTGKYFSTSYAGITVAPAGVVYVPGGGYIEKFTADGVSTGIWQCGGNFRSKDATLAVKNTFSVARIVGDAEVESPSGRMLRYRVARGNCPFVSSRS